MWGKSFISGNKHRILYTHSFGIALFIISVSHPRNQDDGHFPRWSALTIALPIKSQRIFIFGWSWCQITHFWICRIRFKIKNVWFDTKIIQIGSLYDYIAKGNRRWWQNWKMAIGDYLLANVHTKGAVIDLQQINMSMNMHTTTLNIQSNLRYI